VLMFQEMNVSSWEDTLVTIFQPVCYSSRCGMLMTWFAHTFQFPVLGAWITDALVGYFVLVLLLIGLGFKDHIAGTIFMSVTRPFDVGDIVSIQTASNTSSAMTAVAVGFVERLTCLHVVVRNFDMRVEHIPTRSFLNFTVKNWTKRQYKMHHWLLTLSMRTPPGRVMAFRAAAEKILRSHPSCKVDGYVKCVMKTIKDGGYNVEIICFTKPKVDHHAFKMEFSCALSQLASRLGASFVFDSISRETVHHSLENGNAYFLHHEDSEESDATATSIQCTECTFDDLLFHGKATKGFLTAKFKLPQRLKLVSCPEHQYLQSSVMFDLCCSLPRNHPAIRSDTEISWKEGDPPLCGILSVMVDCGELVGMHNQGLTHRSLNLMGVECANYFIEVSIVKPGAVEVEVETDENSAIHHCVSSRQHLGAGSDIVWGETLLLGEVPLLQDKGAQGYLIRLAIRKAGMIGKSSSLLAFAEQPVLELVQHVWKDSSIRLELAADKI